MSTMVQPRQPSFPERPTELRAVLRGALTSATASDWRDGLIALAARRPLRLVLDLQAVTFLDASVVATVRGLERRLASTGGALAIVARGTAAATFSVLGLGHLLAAARAESSV